MNEKIQHLTLDKLIEHCPLFGKHVIYHNKEIKKSPHTTICEVDTLYEFLDYNILIEEKDRDSHSCRKKMNKQMTKYKRYNHCIEQKLGIPYKPTYYFFAYFNNDKTHLEYKGMKK